MPALNDPQHEAFALHVAEGKSKRDAAVAAGYSEKSASTIGGRLSKKVEISRRIEELQAQVATAVVEKVSITVDRLLEEYAKLAFLDIRKAFDSKGCLLPLHEMDDATAAAIAAIEVEEQFRYGGRRNPVVTDDPEEQAKLEEIRRREAIGRILKFKLIDKKGALDSLAKHLGMFRQKVDVDHRLVGPPPKIHVHFVRRKPGEAPTAEPERPGESG